MKYFCLVALFVGGVVAIGANAEEEAVPDRPDATSASANVAGQLIVKTDSGLFPATNVRVTIFSSTLGRSLPVYTSLDGEFYLYDIPPGDYTLEVWFETTFGFDKQLDTAIASDAGIGDPLWEIPALTRDSDGEYTLFFYDREPLKLEYNIRVEEDGLSDWSVIPIPEAFYREAFAK